MTRGVATIRSGAVRRGRDVRVAMASVTALAMLLVLGAVGGAPSSAADSAAPPGHLVKLVFVHHSVGQNWLDDDQGGLGRALETNNYFVSDTNYGWGPGSIGDRTDIPDWTEWFASESTASVMAALLADNEVNSPFERTLADPGGSNEIVMFKSCYPNSSLYGHPWDGPTAEPGMTVGHAKYVYNRLLDYFATRPDKMFVAVTAPPNNDASTAANARAFNNWLVGSWLAGYTGTNVAVFDLYNVLTGPTHHHRFIDGAIEHSYLPGADTLSYPSGDEHPSIAGSQKATQEFVGLLNVYYNRWAAGVPAMPETPVTPIAPGPGADPVVTAIAGWPKSATAKRGRARLVVELNPAQGRSGILQKRVCRANARCRWKVAATLTWPAATSGALTVVLRAASGTRVGYRLDIAATPTATGLVTRQITVKGR